MARESRRPALALRTTPSLADYVGQRLRSLCVATGFDDETDRVVDTVRSLLSPWADARLGGRSSWVSDISDDNTPIEFSVAITENHAELRVLFEPQASEATPEAYRKAGLAFNERLASEFGASLDRFRQVQDLFLPEDMQGPFAVWSSVVFSAGRAPTFKAYFNPHAHGPEQAETLVEEAMRRLGLHAAWPSLRTSALRRGPVLDELKYFALDLTSEAHARIKIYVRHHSASPEDLEMACSQAETYLPGEPLHFTRAMRAGSTPLHVRAPFTCSAFIGENDRHPVSTTIYVPVCAYAHDDAAVRARVRKYMVENDLDPSIYDSIIDGFANRPLDQGVGMQSWIAFRRYRGHVRLTVYLGIEANKVYEPGSIPAPTPTRLSSIPAMGIRTLLTPKVKD